MTKQYDFQDLRYLMTRLRDAESGCPWDCGQDFASLVKYTLEEAFEVADTIERQDFDHLPEELGDLLFQVVFYAQMGEEVRAFDLDDVIHGITAKLVSRHPHVFPKGTLDSQRQPGIEPEFTDIHNVWEGRKSEERAAKGHKRTLADIPLALPALSRAQKVQKRVAKVGFDWPDIRGVLTKVVEELDELQEEITAGNQKQIEDELGDLLFTVVNLSRHLGCDSETALRRATIKFEQRFDHLEEQTWLSVQSLSALSDEELDTLWRSAKKALE